MHANMAYTSRPVDISAYTALHTHERFSDLLGRKTGHVVGSVHFVDAIIII
jgi:hypothetical protein